MAAVQIKFSVMYLLDINLVWSPWTSRGVHCFSLFICSLAMALMGQFWRAIGRNTSVVRASSFLDRRIMMTEQLKRSVAEVEFAKSQEKGVIRCLRLGQKCL